MSRKLPSLLGLRVFECAARHLSFTLAAEELCVTQAAVSHQIRALEEWFGKPLFKRLNRSIKLTESGGMLLVPLTKAFDSIAQITNKVSSEGDQRVLTVAVLDSFASAWVLPRLHNFHARFPDIDVHFVTKQLEEDAVCAGDADMEIRYGKGNWRGLHVYPLLNEVIFPVCSPKLVQEHGPLRKLSDLSRFNLIHDVMSLDWKTFLEHFDVQNVNIRRGFRFNHSHLVIQACIEGNGVALGREALVIDALTKGTLIRPFEETVPSKHAYYIVCRQDSADDGAIKAFAYWLMDEIDLENGIKLISAA